MDLFIQLIFERDIIRMNQSRYMEHLIMNFGMTNFNFRSTSWEIDINKIDAELVDVKVVLHYLKCTKD